MIRRESSTLKKRHLRVRSYNLIHEAGSGQKVAGTKIDRRNKVKALRSDKGSTPWLGGGRTRRSLLIQHWLAHHCVLASHSPSEGAFHLGTKCQLVQVIRLLSGGHKALRLKGLVLETFQAIAEVGDVGHSWVSAGETAYRALGGSERGAAADGGESLGISVLEGHGQAHATISESPCPWEDCKVG